jgi:hypothetical protein
VPNVQIYNTYLDTWLMGASTPNTHDYKAFGTSGTIIGDTIYYFGGAKSSGGFGAVYVLRKGVIDSSNPTDVTWTLEENGPNNSYRSACVSHGNNIFWIGGSIVSYNYDGIAYVGSGGVTPLMQIMRYQKYYKDWYSVEGSPFLVMDLRGVAQVSSTEWIICGGMYENQKVTNKTFLLTYDPVTGGINSDSKSDVYIYDRKIFGLRPTSKVYLFDVQGSLIENVLNGNMVCNNSGVYFVNIINGEKNKVIKVVL